MSNWLCCKPNRFHNLLLHLQPRKQSLISSVRTVAGVSNAQQYPSGIDNQSLRRRHEPQSGSAEARKTVQTKRLMHVIHVHLQYIGVSSHQQRAKVRAPSSFVPDLSPDKPENPVLISIEEFQLGAINCHGANSRCDRLRKAKGWCARTQTGLTQQGATLAA